MFLSVIVAYVITAVFAFCGVMNTVSYVMEAQKEMGYSSFIAGLIVAMWPLAVAMALLMLIQIACLLERWMLLWTMNQSAVPAKPTSGKPAPQPHHRPAPAPASPAMPPPMGVALQPIPQNTPPGHVYPQPQHAAPMQGYPQHPMPAPMSPSVSAAQGTPQSATPTAKPADPRQEGLSFFKLD